MFGQVIEETIGISGIFKNIIFSILAPLITNDDLFPTGIKIIFIIIETLQLISFGFHEFVIKYWKTPDISTIIKDILETFRIIPYIHKAGFELTVVVLYLFSGLLLIIILMSLYRKINKNIRKEKENILGKNILKGVIESFTYIFYLPFIELFIYFFDCSFDQTKSQWIHKDFEDVVCFEGIYLLDVFIAGFSGILTFFIGIQVLPSLL